MNTAPFSNWDDATDLVPWGADSFGGWFFLIVAVIAFFAVIIRAVQHEKSCMVHIVDETNAAAEVAEVQEPEEAVAWTQAVQGWSGTRPGARFAPHVVHRARPASPSPPPLGGYIAWRPLKPRAIEKKQTNRAEKERTTWSTCRSSTRPCGTASSPRASP